MPDLLGSRQPVTYTTGSGLGRLLGEGGVLAIPESTNRLPLSGKQRR